MGVCGRPAKGGSKTEDRQSQREEETTKKKKMKKKKRKTERTIDNIGNLLRVELMPQLRQTKIDPLPAARPTAPLATPTATTPRRRTIRFVVNRKRRKGKKKSFEIETSHWPLATGDWRQQTLL